MVVSSLFVLFGIEITNSEYARTLQAMPLNYKNPWWIDPSTNENLHQHGDAYSIESSLYIEEDDDEDSDEGDDNDTDVNVIPDVPATAPSTRVKAPRSRDVPSSPPPSVPAPYSSGSTLVRPLQEIASKLTGKVSEGSKKLSNSLAKQWSSVRTTLERPKDPPPSSNEEVDVVVAEKTPFRGASTEVNAQEPQRQTSRKSLAESMSQGISSLSKKAASFRRMDHQRTRSTLTETSQRDSRSSRSGSTGSNTSNSDFRRYTVKELVQCLGRSDVDLPPALERRVRDFKFAQGKRRERHGDEKPWGIFGLYAHLSDIRADLEWAEDAAWRRQRAEPYLSWSDFEKARDKGLRNRPWFTYGTIFVCTIMLIVSFGVNGWKVEPMKVNPMIGPSGQTLIKIGARDTNLIVNKGQWYRLFTPLVLHAGLIHYAINMTALYLVGSAVEQAHGFASTAVLFILPAVGGNIVSALCLPQYISVGASGGIFGLIGGCLADISLNWNLLFLKSTADQASRWRHFMVLFWLFFDIFINCIIGFTPYLDNFTHLGGLFYGLCCGLSTIERLGVGFFGLRSDKYSKAWNAFVRFFGLIVSVILIMVTTVLLAKSNGVTSPCNDCRYISCLPFPPRANNKWWYCDDCNMVKADLFVDSGGSGLYRQINLTCPDGTIEDINIASDGMYSKQAVQQALPTFCRKNCPNVFTTSHN